MALLNRKNALKSALAGVAAAGLMSGAALADDAPERHPVAHEVTAEERSALRIANQQSREFAQEGFNIAIVFRGGQDVPNDKFQTHEQVGEVFRERYQKLLDETYPEERYPGLNPEAQVFHAPNPDASASGMAVRIGDTLYQVNNERHGRPDHLDPAILDLSTGWNAAQEIVEVLPVAKAAQLDNEARREASLRPGASATTSIAYDSPQ